MATVPSNLIPTRITQLPDAPSADPDGLLVYVLNGVTYKIAAGDLLQVAGVPTSRNVLAGTGMTGGGPLSSDVTLSIANAGVGATQLDTTGVTAGAYGSATEVPVVTVDANGRVTVATTAPIALTGYVPTTRQVIAGDGLSGGGALNANVTLDANLSDTAPVVASNTGVAGVSDNISRADHQHPAVELADDTQVNGLLGLDNGGTAKSITPSAGAPVWSGADGLYVGTPGLAGQVYVSGGAGAPTWGSALIIADQPANVVYAGPTTGVDAPASFRALVSADMPAGIGTVTSVNASGGTTGLSFSGGPVTTSGTVTLAGTLAVANGGTGGTTSTGSGAVVLATSPTLVTPALGTPSALVGTNITGTAAGLTAGNVTTNANLTGVITSVGNATSIASQTGTGTKFVVDTSPTLVTPNIGVATGTSFQGIIGSVTPAAGTFTTLTSTGNATLGDAEATDTHSIKGATTLLANSASAALTVTQTGAGNAFVVEDSASTDSTPLVVDTNGRSLFGLTAAFPTNYGNTPTVLINSNFSVQALGIVRFTNDIYGADIDFVKSRSTTQGGHTIVQNGDQISNLVFSGSDGVAFKPAASISIAVDGTPGTNDMPGRLVFSTTADGASSPTEAMRINSAQGVSIGTTAAAAGQALRIGKSITGAINASVTVVQATVAADVTSSVSLFDTYPSTQAAAFTLSALNHHNADQGTIGAASAITTQIGFKANSSIVGATNNYGFYSNIASAANRYNFYAAGSADNYFAGSVGVGSTTLSSSGVKVNIGGTYPANGGGGSQVAYLGGNIDPAASTAFAYLHSTFPTVGAGTLPNLTHLNIAQSTFTGTVTSQYGAAATALTGATNNYGFYSNIAAAANRYNFYAAGSAPNYFAGTLAVGGNVQSASYFQAMNGTATPAGGAVATGLFMGSALMAIHFGSGAPTVSAAKGSLYLRSDGSDGQTRTYINTNGTTAWTALASVEGISGGTF